MSDDQAPQEAAAGEVGLVFKTETTGLPDWRGRSDGVTQPHLVRLSAQLIDLTTRDLLDDMDAIIKPDGWEIPDEVVRIHGVTAQHANEVGISEKDALQQFMNMWKQSTVKIAHGMPFQSRIIRIATLRYATKNTQDKWKEAKSFCTAKIAKQIGSPSNRLDDAYMAVIGKTLDNRHDTMAGVDATAELYFKIQELSDAEQ